MCFQKIMNRGHITYVKQPDACISTVQLSWVEWVKGIMQAYSNYNKPGLEIATDTVAFAT